MGAMRAWYVLRGGQPQGPYAAEQMRSMKLSGELREADQVCEAGASSWITVSLASTAWSEVANDNHTPPAPPAPLPVAPEPQLAPPQESGVPVSWTTVGSGVAFTVLNLSLFTYNLLYATKEASTYAWMSAQLLFGASAAWGIYAHAEKVSGASTKRMVHAILAGGLAAALVLGAVLGANSQGRARIEIVQKGHFEAYPSRSVGTAVDSFFGDPRWESISADDGKHYVNVQGQITYMDKPVQALVQFVVDDESGTFEVHAFELNGIPQNGLMQAVLLAKMFGAE